MTLNSSTFSHCSILSDFCFLIAVFDSFLYGFLCLMLVSILISF
nr:MAG TPA: hypothetical protein [Caudoviricetes sp.]